MSKRNNIAYVKPDEPNFLKRIKEQIGYKEGPTLDTKRESLDVTDEDFVERQDVDEQPTVVVLNAGDLTADEAKVIEDKLKREQEQAKADLTQRVVFRKPPTKDATCDVANSSGNVTPSSIDIDKDARRVSTKRSKRDRDDATNKRGKLSFDQEEYDDFVHANGNLENGTHDENSVDADPDANHSDKEAECMAEDSNADSDSQDVNNKQNINNKVPSNQICNDAVNVTGMDVDEPDDDDEEGVNNGSPIEDSASQGIDESSQDDPTQDERKESDEKSQSDEDSQEARDVETSSVSQQSQSNRDRKKPPHEDGESVDSAQINGETVSINSDLDDDALEGDVLDDEDDDDDELEEGQIDPNRAAYSAASGEILDDESDPAHDDESAGEMGEGDDEASITSSKFKRKQMTKKKEDRDTVTSSPEVEEVDLSQDDDNMSPKRDEQEDVINLDTPTKKGLKKNDEDFIPRRSTRNVNKNKSYTEDEDKKEVIPSETIDDSSDDEVMEIPADDPLGGEEVHTVSKMPTLVKNPFIKNKGPPPGLSISLQSRSSVVPNLMNRNSNGNATLTIKDAKRLNDMVVQKNTGKKEPTLVIIDTNQILTGRGSLTVKSTSSNQQIQLPSGINISSNNMLSVMPVSQSVQNIFNQSGLRGATITPVPSTKTVTAPVLPHLTDDMFVVEAPSFIVPYVYEKPPVNPLKKYVDNLDKTLKDESKKKAKKDKKKDGKEDDEEESDEDDDKADDDEDSDDVDPLKDAKTGKDEKKEPEKPKTYFENPLGKFFMNIGMGLVNEYVQTELLKQAQRRRNKDDDETNTMISRLKRSLQTCKENNEPYKMQQKKCDYCSFKTESALVLAHHLETPHMKNYVYKCNFCPNEVRSPHDILFHMEAEHNIRGHLERAPGFHQCPNCPFEDNQKGKLTRHMVPCGKKFKPEKNLEPPIDWEPPAKIPRMHRGKQVVNSLMPHGLTAAQYQQFIAGAQKNAQGRGVTVVQPVPQNMTQNAQLAGLAAAQQAALVRQRGRPQQQLVGKVPLRSGIVFQAGQRNSLPNSLQYSNSQVKNSTAAANKAIANKLVNQPSISITPLPRQQNSNQIPNPFTANVRPGDPATAGQTRLVVCEICDGYIKDLEQLRNHMQWIHKIKIHPKMIYNRPPLNCQKCQFRFFTDQGLERHLLGSHGLVTSSMQDASNNGKDAGRCPVCGRIYQWKLLNHVSRDHKITLKPAHLSYKCTVCTATFGMYKQFESHVYSAHSVVAKRVIDKKGGGGGTVAATASAAVASSSKANSGSGGSSSTNDVLKPLKINDEITIIPQPVKPKPKSTG